MKYLNIIITVILLHSSTYAEEINYIEVTGNNRISDNTIIMLSKFNKGDSMNTNDINQIIKNIYQSDFFENVEVKLLDETLTINVTEYPLIQDIKFIGTKNKNILNKIEESLILKPRKSFNEIYLIQDFERIDNQLKKLGYYFSDIKFNKIELDDNKIDLIYSIELGEKSKIKSISFLGNKSFKDSKLKSLIISEEYKFWKFLSGKKFLNEDLIEFDRNLLKNFYLNNGFYRVEIVSSFVKLTDDNQFEIIFNINENEKFFFNTLSINLPQDFSTINFNKLNREFENLKGEPYSINALNSILQKIELITLEEEFKSTETKVIETVDNNLISLDFIIKESEKFRVDKINIFGNNITEETVIRNQFEIDEGDIFNSILQKKTINNIKSLNIFKTVESKITTNDNEKTKSIDINIVEKPTGEIMAGAGAGTDGATFLFAIKENNYLGQGLKINSEINLSKENLKGTISLINPNFRNSDKSVSASIQSLELDKLDKSGYKTNRSTAAAGTKFEYKDDFFLGITPSVSYEDIQTSSTASTLLKKQNGNSFDIFMDLNFDYDKRNQKYQTSKGYRTAYSVGLPLVSNNNTLKNNFSYTNYMSLYDNNLTKLSINLISAHSISNDNIKISERVFIPGNKLRGFESGKVGPKDNKDYIGGNYASFVNISSTLPKLFEDSQNIDLSIFSDIGNVWHVDYDSSVPESNKIRSSLGIGIDWFTVVGPLTFSLATPITKASTDKTETFRFNIGTTF